MNQIKTKKLFIAILTILLAISLAVGVVIVGQSANEINVTAKIAEKNVDYRAMARLAFSVELFENAPDGEVGIAMWNNEQSQYTLSNTFYTSFEMLKETDGREYFLGAPISLTEMTTVYRVAVIIKTDNGVIISSEPEECSVEMYANERLEDLEATYAEEGALTEKQANQKNLYEKLLAVMGLPSHYFNDLTPYITMEASVLPLRGGAKGAVAIVHDDGDITTLNLLDKILVDNGLVADVALILNKVYDTTTGTVKADELDAFSQYLNNGRWGIINHSATHNWWSDLNSEGNPVVNEERLNFEVVTSQEKLRELFPSHQVLTYAYPGFSYYEGLFDATNDPELLKEYIYTDEARDLIMEHHIAARHSRGDTAYVENPETAWDWVYGYFLTPDRVDKYLKDVLDYAAISGQIVVASIHALTEDESLTGGDGYYMLNDYMKTACEMIAERVNSGKLWNAHYEDIILYVREAQSSSIEAIYDENNEQITVSLTDTLDNSIYNSELTVRVKLVDGWSSVKITQNGKTFYKNAIDVDGKSMVQFDMMPDTDDAIITPVIKEEDAILESDFGITLSNGTKIDTNYFPGFVRKAVTFSMDDGIVTNDSPFIDIVKKGGILGTFNLINANSKYGLSNEEYVALYSGYEVANHHLFHPLPWFGFDGFEAEDFANVPIHETIIYSDSIKNELDSSYIYKTGTEGLYYIDYNYHFAKNYSSKYWHPIMTNDAYAKYVDETKDNIESVFGKGSVVGFAYPHGKTNDTIKAYLESAGYLYARRTIGKADNTTFPMPADRYDWSYNASHSNLNSIMSDFAAYTDDGNLKFFCFGVHPVDYKNAGWDELETFVSTYGNRSDEFYYATIRDIFEYEDAIKALDISENAIVNNSNIDVFVTVNNQKVVIGANSTYTIE